MGIQNLLLSYRVPVKLFPLHASLISEMFREGKKTTANKNYQRIWMFCSSVESFLFFSPLKPPAPWQVWLSARTHPAAVSVSCGSPEAPTPTGKRWNTPFCCRTACGSAPENAPHKWWEDARAPGDWSEPSEPKRGGTTQVPGRGNFREKTH